MTSGPLAALAGRPPVADLATWQAPRDELLSARRLTPARVTPSPRLVAGCRWWIHRPGLGEALVGSDYRSEIFYTSDDQRQVAEDTSADASDLWPGKVVTKISEASSFWEAEAEDQNYLQHYPYGSNEFSPKPSTTG